jgi:hypothetical protein
MRPNERPIVAAALLRARPMRLRWVCFEAARPTAPIFRIKETLLTASILAVLGATMTKLARGKTVSRLRASNASSSRIESQTGMVDRGACG